MWRRTKLVQELREYYSGFLAAFTAGSYSTMNGPFTIVDYPSRTPPRVSTWSTRPVVTGWRSQTTFQRFTAMFDDITELAQYTSQYH